MRIVKSEENIADLGSDPLSKVVIAKHCLALGICEHGRRNWLVQAARSCDVLGLQFDAHDGDG